MRCFRTAQIYNLRMLKVRAKSSWVGSFVKALPEGPPFSSLFHLESACFFIPYSPSLPQNGQWLVGLPHPSLALAVP